MRVSQGPRLLAALARDARGACHLCGARPGVEPAATTDKYSLGKVDVGEAALSFTLLRAPDGAVLDTVSIPRKTRALVSRGGE